MLFRRPASTSGSMVCNQITWPDNGAGVHELAVRSQSCYLGELSLEYSAFAVDGPPDLSMLIYNPVGEGDTERIWKLIAARDKKRKKA